MVPAAARGAATKYLDGLLELGQLYFSRANYAQAAEVYRRAIQKESILEGLPTAS